MIKIVICDDSSIDSEITYQFVNDFIAENNTYDKHLNAYVYNSPVELLNSIERGVHFDIFLLDVMMPKITGITLGKTIRQHDPNAIIIYLSISKEYSLDAFGVYAYQYMLKPLHKEQLWPILKNALSSLKLISNLSYTIKTADSSFNVNYKDIIYIEHMNHTPYFHLTNGFILVGTSIRTSFEKSIESLFNCSYFIKTHQSFVVNFSHVKSYDGHKFIVTDGYVIPISQNNLIKTKKAYYQYIESLNTRKL